MPPQESCHPGAQKCGSHSHKPYCHAQNNKNTPKNLKTEDAVQPLESKTKAYIHAGDAKKIRTYLDENEVAYLQQSTLGDAQTEFRNCTFLMTHHSYQPHLTLRLKAGSEYKVR